MERLKLRYASADRALNTLIEILKEPFSIVVRDAAIQRFEYTFEAVWKLVREYLHEVEGIVCVSAKSCIRSAVSVGLMNEEEGVAALEMVDDRNLTSHTYHEEVAQKIFSKLYDYSRLMSLLLERIKQNTPQHSR